MAFDGKRTAIKVQPGTGRTTTDPAAWAREQAALRASYEQQHGLSQGGKPRKPRAPGQSALDPSSPPADDPRYNGEFTKYMAEVMELRAEMRRRRITPSQIAQQTRRHVDRISEVTKLAPAVVEAALAELERSND